MSQLLRSTLESSAAGAKKVSKSSDPRITPAVYPPLPTQANEPSRNYFFLGWPVNAQFFDEFAKYYKLDGGRRQSNDLAHLNHQTCRYWL
ncbi:hypothetical protein HGRIS_008836 [Hohenbuehelia grisea]|uniref:Uncharacterized protein n=1 Tax=Hohenbuehelia grisea TaxID=104357 RepID=A0ABR3IZC2_9AGAR